jgi:hypothetical protein
MKKIYQCYSTLICLSFLFTLDSCTSDPDFVPNDTLGKTAFKNEDAYYNSRKEDVLPATSVATNASAARIPNKIFNTSRASDSISTYSTMAANDPIDPDWKKLTTHFVDSSGSTK